MSSILASAAVPDASYSRTFNQGGVSNTSEGTGRSPARSGTNDNWIAVISKLNQPRKTGTNPHIGVDIYMAEGTTVYSSFPGTVSAKNPDISGQLGSVTVYSDIDGDGTKDTYIKYQHIVPSSIEVGKAVTVNTILGTIDTVKIYSPAHLHMQRDDTNGYHQTMRRLFMNVTAWNNGYDMEFPGGGVTVSPTTGVLTVKGYSINESGSSSNQRYGLSKMTFYYRKNSSSTWNSIGMTALSNYTWQVNLRNLSGVTVGETLRYYIVGDRASLDPGCNTDYTNGFWPMYFQTPFASGPNAISDTNKNLFAESVVVP